MKKSLISFMIAMIAGLTVAYAAMSVPATERNIRDPKKLVKIVSELTGERDVSSNVGAVNGATVTATERIGNVQKTTITLASTPVIVAEGGTGTNGYGGTKIYDFPEGQIRVLGVIVQDVTVVVDAALDNADGGDFALGTAVASDGAMSGAMVDFCPSTSIDPITNVTSAVLADAATFDGTTTAKDLYINMTVDDADISATATNTVSATVVIQWVNLGDK